MEHKTSSDRQEAESCWEEIGIQLEIEDYQLGHIRNKHTDKNNFPTHKSDLAFRDMLRAWFKKDNPTPTLSLIHI